MATSFTGLQILLLPGPAVLEPDLGHPLAEAGDLERRESYEAD